MGYMFLLAPCFICGARFSSNPNRVPSIRDEHNERQPLCQSCVKRGNELRVEKGLEPFAVHADAYEPEEVL